MFLAIIFLVPFVLLVSFTAQFISAGAKEKDYQKAGWYFMCIMLVLILTAVIVSFFYGLFSLAS